MHYHWLRIAVRSLGLAIGAAAILLAGAPLGHAQQEQQTHEPTVEEITRLKQNPVSGLRSVFFQNETASIGGKPADVFSIQPVWPFGIGEDWKLITYTIIPMASLPPVASGSSAQGRGSGLQSLPAASPSESPT